MKKGLPRKQKGAAALEFAMVFMIFFAVFYGLLSYSLPLLLLQSFNQATAEGVRRGVALDPTTPGYADALKNRAIAAAQAQLQWLPPAFKFVPAYVTATYSGTGMLTVQINYPSDNLKSVLPFLVLPGLGTVPNLPATLSAQASLQF
ncbi:MULTISPECIES: TadE/TadG family type IV pilus assembly protein [Pseudomonas]|uniref:Pilus assembly protein n=1 Tax=Pseudomonas fluorescens TaxID=294 RepID=A0A7Z6MYM9_PSEFL|nr:MULTISPECIES: TadE/TadG family type IV pilus assembly protein [Pseudomonas]OCW21622.1 pilus assembly protein TadE [Pseudomonas sp. S3E12]QDG58464.1 pilus assembly protein [Pseudomonas sp. NIBRBAC000502773]RDS91390.1 pilus assembly protein [Pseudomonas fluorescens]